MQFLWAAAQSLLSADGFAPHGFCLLWDPALVWLYVASDALISISYYTIPAALVLFVHKRQDLAFSKIFLLFGAFIIACGTTHVMDIITLWYPAYWLAGLLKAATAVISVTSVYAVWRAFPLALKLPSTAQLEEANRRLSEESAKQTIAAARVRELNATLEERILERTAELERAKEDAEAASVAI